MKDFVDQVQQVFREMDGNTAIEALGNEDSHFFHSIMQLDSSLSSGIFHSENLVGSDHSLVLPSQLFPCTSNQLEQLVFESASFPDCSASHQDFISYTDCNSLLNSSWDNISLSNAQSFSSSIVTPTDPQAQRLSGLLTVEEFFAQSDFCQLISPHNMSHSSGLMKGSSLSGRNSASLPTNSLQSSVTHALRSSDDAKCSMGIEPVGKKPVVWTESECISEKNSKMSSSNSLFSKLGLDQLLDTSPSSFEDQSSSAAKRRRTGSFSWSQNQVKFDGKMKSYNPEAKNNEVSSEDFKEVRSCIDDSCALDASSSKRHEEQSKTKKKKAKPGTKPRPKDRQMIQDRLGELRELIPNGEKVRN